jgi:hypothetical protein
MRRRVGTWELSWSVGECFVTVRDLEFPRDSSVHVYAFEEIETFAGFVKERRTEEETQKLIDGGER